MKHIIINVGRQLGSGGHDIGRMLALDFKAKYYDRELLNLAAKESGFSEKFFEQNDEKKGFFKGLFNMQTSHISGGSMYKTNFSQESLFQFQSDAIQKAAQEGSCVFVGRCADYILRDFPNTVNIFITASMKYRIEQIMNKQHMEYEEARKFIESKESNRSAYYNYFTGKKWGAAESYDLCIDSSILGLMGTEQIIAEYIRKRFNL
ncbi:MAG: cytidylate kinase-like family protein [Prevotella sp.]|jgi:cytidylate kinase|nr:cytidylate kinase-like family protein [Prevotella sp.]